MGDQRPVSHSELLSLDRADVLGLLLSYSACPLDQLDGQDNNLLHIAAMHVSAVPLAESNG